MKVTPEMMAKFEKCKSAEDVLELAKQQKISLTLEQAQKAFDIFRSEDISDEEMMKVTGGWCECEPYGSCPVYGTPECGMYDGHGGVM